jgi:DNA-directed RNA polymerase subunit RPC12/RpoP
MASNPCPACGEQVDVTRTKSGKPYLSCEGCGYQGFVRGRKGVERFTARHGESWKAGKPSAADGPSGEKPSAAAAAKAPAKETRNDFEL